jgi:hypothetical protein
MGRLKKLELEVAELRERPSRILKTHPNRHPPTRPLSHVRTIDNPVAANEAVSPAIKDTPENSCRRKKWIG